MQVTATELSLRIEDGDRPITLHVRGEKVVVTTDAEIVLALADQGPLIEGEPPDPVGSQRADGTIISAIVPSGD